MKMVKDKWRAVLVGSEELNDLSDPMVVEKIAQTSRACRDAWKCLNKSPDRYILFGDKHPTDSVDLADQYIKIVALSRGWATYGSEYYHNDELRADILDCLQWMYENMYGEAEIQERGWRSPKAYDWWHWYVGGVEPLQDSLLLLEEYIPMEKMEKYLRCFKYALTIHRIGFLRPFAMSRIKVCTRAGLLLEDAKMICDENRDYDLILTITKNEEGIHTDYVEWTHGYPYNMMYGNNNLCRVAYMGAMLGGTPLEFISPRQYRLFNVAKYMFEAACYQGRGFMGFNGRGISGKEMASGVSIANGFIPMIGLFGEDEDRYLKKVIKRYCKNPEFLAALKSACSLYYLSKLKDILADESISYENDYEMTYAWYTGDRVAKHGKGHAFMLCMPSSRHPSYESIDEANRYGWYTCDGALYLYTDADPHSFDGAHFIANERIAYRIPGTTVDSQKRIPWAHRSGWRTARSFSGCMQLDYKYAVGAFDYESYNYAGHENDNTTDGGYGGGFLYHENDLVAKKSYFFLDKECVCLGAGITSTMNSEVQTTVEHRRLVKDTDTAFGLEDIYLDGALMPKNEYSEIRSNADFVTLEGVGSYVFLEKADIYLNKYSVKGEMKVKDMYFRADAADARYKDAGKPFFELGISHGANPDAATYAYAILPTATSDEASAYAKAPEVEIISNTPECQALRKSAEGVSFYVFHQAGTCEDITVSEPCIVAVKTNGSEYRISVCDPTQKLTGISVSVAKALKLTDAVMQYSVNEGESTEITVDVTNACGESFSAYFTA
jgi:hyaluronate lyase